MIGPNHPVQEQYQLNVKINKVEVIVMPLIVLIIINGKILLLKNVNLIFSPSGVETDCNPGYKCQ